MAFVLDASTTLSWHFEDEAPNAVRATLRLAFDEGVVVPQHWLLEVSSALLRGERRNRSPIEDTDAFLSRLGEIPIESAAADPDRIAGVIIPLARSHHLSVYDAAYLELAGRRELPLATLDRSLARAARAVGVALIEGL
ncbi:MAG TPA: type II toxin-antitoxin system VapC family toxin [Allosphingosinicella sp.]|nr:type II toxin-antitoxin system VapC family toxin [Allosphingosinicella sp.]